MQELQQEKLRIIGLEWMIPFLLTSERAGVTKPGPAIYEWALRETGLNAGNVLMVDIKAALRCGLSAALYAPESDEGTVSTEHGMATVITEWAGLFELIAETDVIRHVNSPASHRSS